MGVTIFKIFIWGGISSDMLSEITFNSSADVSESYLISDHMSADITPKMKILNSYPLKRR